MTATPHVTCQLHLGDCRHPDALDSKVGGGDTWSEGGCDVHGCDVGDGGMCVRDPFLTTCYNLLVLYGQCFCCVILFC